AATEVALGSTKLPPAFFTFTVPRELALSNDSSAYPMAPSVCFTAAVTPSEPLAPWPVGHGTSLAAPNVHTDPAAAVRYDVNAAVVPEPSERWITWMPSEGSVTPLLVALMAAAFHLVIFPAKMPAIVSGVSCRLVTPLRLNSTAMAPAAHGMWSTGPTLASASVCSKGFIVTSDPAKSMVPAMSCWMPAPEPTAW